MQRRARQGCARAVKVQQRRLGREGDGATFDSHRFRADRSACTEVRGLALTTAHPSSAGSQAGSQTGSISPSSQCKEKRKTLMARCGSDMCDAIHRELVNADKQRDAD